MTTDYESQRKWGPETQMVRGPTERGQFDETNEAIFLSSGYVYKTAEEAEKSFKNESERYVYSRFRNPTVSMFKSAWRSSKGPRNAALLSDN
jgi:O-succinylhomoserine sulfhydrylase